MKSNNIFCVLMIALLSFAGIKSSKAEIITFYPDQVLGDGTAPASQPPWIAASFDDHGSQGLVTLTLTCVNLTESKYVGNWFFNLDPLLIPSQLKFTNKVKTGSFSTPTFWTGANSFSLNGGQYDIWCIFSSNNDHSKRFDMTDTFKVDISGISSLNALSFEFFSQGTPSDGVPPALTAANIAGVGYCIDDSTITVPEPSLQVSAFCGLLGMAVYFRRRVIYKTD